MRIGIRNGSIGSAAAAVVLVGLTQAGTASAALVDDFSSGNLSPYTLTRVNDANTTSDISFTSTRGDLQATAGATIGTVEQVLFLRSDYAVPVGQSLYANVDNYSTNTNSNRDIGIAIGYTATPPGLSGTATGDVRSSYVEVSIRADNQIVSYARDGSTNLTSGQIFNGQGTPALTNTDPLALYIFHRSANVFDVGFYQNNVQQQLLEYTFTSANVPGAAVGFYSDLRAPLTTVGGLDNLSIGTVPEPASLAVLGLGGLAAVRRRRTAAV